MYVFTFDKADQLSYTHIHVYKHTYTYTNRHTYLNIPTLANTCGLCWPQVFPRSITEFVDSDEFERVWRNAAADQMAKRFGADDHGGRDDQSSSLPTRNMVGDYVVSDEFHQAVCKGGNQGMSSMGGMMGGAPAPWSYMGTFIGSEKFQHGTCDMMSQGMTQFGEGMNGMFRSDATGDSPVDPLQVVDAFFRSEYYGDTKDQLQRTFSDVRF